MNDYDVRRRLALFPFTTTVKAGSGSSRLAIAGCDLGQLAAEHGTPLYLYDQATLDASLNQYQQALAASYPGDRAITYAGKATSTSAPNSTIQSPSDLPSTACSTW